MFLKLKNIVKTGNVKCYESMKKHTSFKIGGKAKYFVKPGSVHELLELLDYLCDKKIKHYVLGNGTNVVFADKGFKGVVVSMLGLNEIRKYENYVQVFAGVTLNQLCNFYKQHNLGGLEDAFGIPGSIGGAVVMNAGAYNFETKNVVLGVTAIIDGKVNYLTNQECEFAYRHSGLKNAVIISVDFKFCSGCNKERMKEIICMRKEKQPLDKPSAGSVFKRCDGIIVSKLIDDLGLKGARVGGAMVSPKHAGFIVNVGNATCSDVKELVKNIKQRVKAEHNIVIEEEIEFVE